MVTSNCVFHTPRKFLLKIFNTKVGDCRGQRKNWEVDSKVGPYSLFGPKLFLIYDFFNWNLIILISQSHYEERSELSRN